MNDNYQKAPPPPTNWTLNDLDIIKLDPIIISPTSAKQSKVLNLQQTFTFPQNFLKQNLLINPHKETFTQTSKTLINVTKALWPNSTNNGWELGRKLSQSELCLTSTERLETVPEGQLVNHHHQQHESFRLPTQKNLNKPELELLKKLLPPQQQQSNQRRSITPVYTTRKIINPVRPASKKNLFKAMKQAEYLISPRCESIIEEPSVDVEQKRPSSRLYLSASTSNSSGASAYSNDITLASVLDKLYDGSWNVSYEGLNELLYIAARIDWNQHERDISGINRKLIYMFRSPRSTVCRVTCQVAGELFRIVKCTKRPEFDEIVDTLLAKTADSNRFIQKDANVALDKMVTYISSFHSVRALCAKGPK